MGPNYLRVASAASCVVSLWGLLIPNPVKMGCNEHIFISPGCQRIVYTALIERDGAVASTGSSDSVKAFVDPGEASALRVAVNGVVQPIIHLSASIFKEVLTLSLPFHAGINTIDVSSYRTIPKLDIPAASKPPALGAAVNYIELEAENATFTGNIIGPDFTFTTLSSEASSRMAVQLEPWRVGRVHATVPC